MAKILSTNIEDQIDARDIKPVYTIKINSVDLSDYFINYSLSYDTQFGSSFAQFTLVNQDNIFGFAGSNELFVGDTVEFFEQFGGDSTVFKKFYGTIENRSMVVNSNETSIVITCLDYISNLRNLDIVLKQEGTKVKIEDETLDPQFLTDVGKTMFAQVFNFSNQSIATNPPPVLTIRDKGDTTEELQYDGFDVIYNTGQVKFGAPIQALDNYDVIAKSYYTYTKGLDIEDIIEDIFSTSDGYGGFLFGETSAENVVSNHLTSTFLEEQGLDAFGSITDTLVPNYTTQSIDVGGQLLSAYTPTVEYTTTLASDYDYTTDTSMYLTDVTGFVEPDSGSTETAYINGFKITYTGIESGNVLTGVVGSYYFNSGATALYRTDTPVTSLNVPTDGLPSSGSANISGDIFTWTSKDATHLYGIPSSGENSLSAHPVESYLSYEIESASGRVWYMRFNNITSTLTDSDFTIPSGSSIDYIDHKYGRIILDSAISTSSSLTCDVDYTFKTLQSTGVELSEVNYTERGTNTRFDALQDLKSKLAPNYIIRTQGDDKIWGSYMTQAVEEDYTLELSTQYNHMEDSDLYTRVVLFGKNKNPTNILFNDGVQFITSGESYKSLASNDELVNVGTLDGWHYYETSISRAGYITADEFVPVIYINNVKVDNKPHEILTQPVHVEKTTKTVTITKKTTKTSSQEVFTYYYYEVDFPHQSLYPSEPIYVYDSSSTLQYTLPPYSEDVDYSRGVWTVPGDELNTIVEDLSTASYNIFYASDLVRIDYDNVVIAIRESMIPDPTTVIVNADYEYIHTMTPVNGINKVFDGRWDTQVQTEFFSNPPTGYNYAILDLGQVYTIEALDLIAGFYEPDTARKYDIDIRVTLQYSLDNSDYYDIGDALTSFDMQGGSSISFEEDDLGVGFQARYIKLILDNVEKLDIGTGVWPVSFTEISAYSNIILKAESKLIPIAYNTGTVTAATTTINVDTTLGFTEPESAEEITAYIDDNEFTYTGLTSTSFTGVTIGSGESYTTGAIISKSVKTDADIYDYDNLYAKQGDRLYKQSNVSDSTLYYQETLDSLSKAFLQEYVKDHTKVQVTEIFCPYINVGNTIRLIDTVSGIDRNYFVEAIQSSGYQYNLTLAYYPAS